MHDRTDSALKRFLGLEPFPEPPLLRLRYPVVLMHGFGLLAALRRGGQLHHEAMNLRAHGVLAYAPNVAAYNTVKVRSTSWQRRLEHVLRETGADRLNIIAQSMGGLDARYLISRLGMHEVVASLVTVSTPHHGTGVADFVLERPERVRTWLADVFNWMGASSLSDATSDFLSSVAELTPEYVREHFNSEAPDHQAVRYYSFGGRAGKGTDVPLNPLLQILNRTLYAREGENDGFVSIESAMWGEFLGTIDADHSQQVGIGFPGSSDFDSNVFYCEVVKRLAADGF